MKNNTTLKWMGGAALIALMIFLAVKIRLKLAQEKAIQACENAFGYMNATQQDSIRKIVAAFHRYGDGDKNKLAYILATAWHESHFRPVQERRAAPNQTELYNRQNQYWSSGYFGRGFVQLTWKENYQKMARVFRVDFVNQPDLALQPTYAARILVYGMMQGSFTGLALKDFINAKRQDFYKARQVVNRLDRAGKIAEYGKLLT
ncbi:glycoside hydrolase family 19 protein [Aureispira sp. CCB-QB1]|uniref:glycoside hydrolase family 19 protein n=1 Tax=Aureispira sp. CCB-QB1 TaxID=1313421 RepID=UPI00069847AC|nr:glycoside hydrolase family 19 protein [Aureispira sp. CCB-QB1]